MTLTRGHLRRIIAVAHAREKGFVQLAGMAELDPARAFHGASLAGADLHAQDLAGFDFTAGSFRGCNLRGASLSLTKCVTPAMLTEAITYAQTHPSPPQGQMRSNAPERWLNFGPYFPSPSAQQAQRFPTLTRPADAAVTHSHQPLGNRRPPVCAGWRQSAFSVPNSLSADPAVMVHREYPPLPPAGFC
jgi:hypothetical protein